MRAKAWFGPATAALLGGALMAGCAAPRQAPEGVVETGDGLFTLALRGASPAAAVERGLNQASQHCADRNRMISVQSTRIERDGYRIAFRCLEVPGGVPVEPGAALAAAPASPARPAPGEAPAAPPAVPPASFPQAAAPAPRPVSPAGTPLPMASSALPPIAGGGVSGAGAAARPAGGLAPSSFWQSGR